MNTDANINEPEKQRALKFLGDTVREARENQFMTLYTAAELSGMDVSELENLEAGRLDPDFIGLFRLCEALEIDLGALFERALAECRQEPPGASA